MKSLLSVLSLVIGLSSFCQAQQPTAEEIIAGAKMSAILQQADLTGSMSNSRAKVNIALFLRNQDIQFQYWEGKDWKKFHMQMNDDKCRLLEMVNGKQQDFPTSRIAMPIAGTDLTFEDLAMRFFYWKKPVLEGVERVGTHNCWKIRLNNPGVGGAYQVMYVWVHQKYGAFMKIEGFNREGKILKRFEVTDVMSIKSATGASVYTLKQMNVSTLNPSNGRSVSLTKLIFEEPKMLAPKGPR
jgi:Outer membrane lipoprotein-sorting protein